MKNKKPLDYLLIPNSLGKIRKQRNARAKEEAQIRDIKKIKILKGKDSEEDILKLGKILKRGQRIGIVTFPLHFKEYQDIIQKAEREKKFPKEVMVEGILTDQTAKEFVYGELGLGEEKNFEKKVDYEKNRKNKFLDFVKNILKKMINLSD